MLHHQDKEETPEERETTAERDKLRKHAMANRVMLDNVAHQDLRVAPRHGPEFGDSVNQVIVFPTEYADVQREYPILFRKDSNGDYVSIAILGLDKDENLFLEGEEWRARYVPAIQARGPFLIGLAKENAVDSSGDPKINIDLDDPRVSETQGEALFLPHGGNAPYLERMAHTLNILYDGVALSKRMFAAFDAAQLIEPVTIEISLREGAKYAISDCYAISRERLASLDGATLETLNKDGFLHLAFLAISSLGNMSRLIDMKERRRAQG